MSDADDLKTLVGQPDEITVGGKTMKINKIRMHQLPEVIAFCAPIKDQLFRQKPADGTPPAKPIDFEDLITNHNAEVVQLVASIQSHGHDWVTPKWVGDLEVDECIELISRVPEANLDFFSRKVVPALSRELVRLNAAVKAKLPPGTTLSQSLSPQGTPGSN